MISTNRSVRLSASIMCGDPAELRQNIDVLEAFHVDLLHIDFMDGHFVDNLVIGTNMIKEIRLMTSIPLDIHLMHESAEQALDMIDVQETDQVMFHIRSSRHPWRLADEIRRRGGKAGLVIPTETPVSVISEMLPAFDFVQVMSVPTGIAGAPFFEKALQKTENLKQLLVQNKRALPVQMDGSIHFDNMMAVMQAGVDVMILGYLACFNQSMGICNALTMTRELVDRYHKSINFTGGCT